MRLSGTQSVLYTCRLVHFVVERPSPQRFAKLTGNESCQHINDGVTLFQEPHRCSHQPPFARFALSPDTPRPRARDDVCNKAHMSRQRTGSSCSCDKARGMRGNGASGQRHTTYMHTHILPLLLRVHASRQADTYICMPKILLATHPIELHISLLLPLDCSPCGPHASFRLGRPTYSYIHTYTHPGADSHIPRTGYTRAHTSLAA